MVEDANVLDITTVSECQLPSIIATQFSSLTALENNVQKAVNLAAEAKKRAQNAQVSAGWFKKKEAIELLQNATQGLAEAQISASDAQKLLFEYQTKLTEITKYLFGLGVSNIAMNRSVVREIELKLKGASDEDISELAKQELRNVIRQLMAQEDMMKKQEFLTGKVKEQAGQIKAIDQQLDEMEEADEEQDERIAENAERLANHAKVLSLQQQKGNEHDKRIAEHTGKLYRHEVALQSHEMKDKEFEKLFAEQDKEDEKQDLKIAENTERIVEHEKTLGMHHQKDEEIEEKVNKNAERIKKLDSSLKQQGQAQECMNQAFEKSISELSKNVSNELTELRNIITTDKELWQTAITSISDKFDKDISDVKLRLGNAEGTFDKKLDGLSENFKNALDQLSNDFMTRNTEVDNKIVELSSKIAVLENYANKKIWKILVSVIASVSLILSVLQMCGIT